MKNTAVYSFLIFLSMSRALQASDTLRLKGSSWGVSFSPDFCYRTLDYTRAAQWIAARRNAQETRRLGYTFGITYSRKMGERFSLDAAVLFSDRGFKTCWEKLEWGQTDDISLNRSRIVFHNNYISIPIKLDYYFQLRRVQFFISGGLAADIFLQQRTVLQIQSTNGEKKREISPEPDVYSRMNLAGQVSAGIVLPLAERLSLRVEPAFRRSLTPVLTRVENKEYFYSAGLTMSIFLRLKHRS